MDGRDGERLTDEQRMREAIEFAARVSRQLRDSDRIPPPPRDQPTAPRH